MHPTGLLGIPGGLSPNVTASYGPTQHPTAFGAGNGRGWGADCGEFEGAAKIFLIGEMRKKCDF